MKSLLNTNNVHPLSKLFFLKVNLALVLLAIVGCQSKAPQKKNLEAASSSFNLASRTEEFLTGQDALMTARMNAPFFYRWLADEQKTDAGLKNLLQITGIVGDSHFLNYSEWLTKSGKLIIRPNDPDDYGKGPLIAEIMRFSTVALAAGYDLKAKDLVEAYFQGLSGKPAIAPPEVQKVEKMTASQYEQEQKKYRQSLYTTNDGYYYWTRKARIIPTSEAPEDLKAYFAIVKVEFDQWLLQNKYTALADGFSIKKDGGSAGYPRFYFLAEDQTKTIRIIEFKYEPQMPAVGFFSPDQQAFEKRIDLMEQFCIGTYVGTTFDAIEVHNGKSISQFYVREKLKTLYDLVEVSDRSVTKKNIMYLARQIGYWTSLFQSKSSAAFIKQFLTPQAKTATIQKMTATIEKFHGTMPQ